MTAESLQTTAQTIDGLADQSVGGIYSAIGVAEAALRGNGIEITDHPVRTERIRQALASGVISIIEGKVVPVGYNK